MATSCLYVLDKAKAFRGEGLRRPLTEIFGMYEKYKVGHVGPAELGRYIRYSPNRRVVLAAAIETCADALKDNVSELQIWTNIISICSELLQLSGKIFTCSFSVHTR